MINLLIALALGAAAFAGAGLAWGWIAAILPGGLISVIAYGVLAWRTGKQVEVAMAPVTKALSGKNFDQAIALLEPLRALGRWQFLVTPIIDAQIGMIYYAYKADMEKALPYLENGYVKQWQAPAMLAALHYRRKSWDKMEQAWELAAKNNKKTSTVWAGYAWCLWKRGDAERAQAVLGRGLEAIPGDERLQKNLLALQNGQKMKMKAYAEEWWALMLEKPPMQVAAAAGRGGRGRRMPR